MKQFGILVLGVTLISACSSGNSSSGPGMTNAQRQMAHYQSVGSLAGATVKSCSEQLLNNSENAAAAALIPLHNSAILSVEQLSNTAKPTATDMKRIVDFQQGIAQCWNSYGTPIRSIDPTLASFIDTDLRDDALIVADLMRGQLTLGDANRRMQSEDVSIKGQIDAHMRQTANGFAQQHQNELALASARARADSAYIPQLQIPAYSAPAAMNNNYQPPQIYSPQVGGGSNFMYCRQLGSYVTSCR